jgi:hypothetical protein
MRHSISVDSAIADDWEVEPEVYEVECEWRVDGSGNCAPWCLDGNYIPKIEGKRTKLTIEVLD